MWPALERAHLRRVTIHSLRHSFASALILQGAPITEVQHLLGHSSPAVTLKVYSHWFRDLHTDSLASLSTAVFRNSRQQTKEFETPSNQRNCSTSVL